MSSRRCFLCEEKPTTSATLHRFPKDDVTRSLWLQICNLNVFDNVSTIKICSEHFTIEDYQNPVASVYGAVLRLKDGTIPTVDVPNPIVPISRYVNKLDINVDVTTNVASTYQQIAKTSKLQCCTSQEENPLPEMLSTSTNTQNEIQMYSSPAMPQQLPGQAVDISDTKHEDKQLAKNRRCCEPRYMRDESSLDCQTIEQINLSLKLAKTEIIKERRKARVLQQKNRRLQNKLIILNGLLSILQTNTPITEDVSNTIQ